ncbi:MAG TPA: hypothetical protein VMV71_00070 [Candidatus Paceibacterota bacterium]|nr:hypothetical protein [Candidatus Paceibacterota bacterium]
MKIIVSAVFFLFSLALSAQVFAGGKYPVCKGVPQEIHLTIKNPFAEIQLKPDCWSSLVVVADYAKTIDTFYAGKGKVESLRLVGIIMVNDTPVVFALNNRFRLRGDGKITIRISSYNGAEI